MTIPILSLAFAQLLGIKFLHAWWQHRGTDTIYANNENRQYCTENGITTCLVRKGPKPKDEDVGISTHDEEHFLSHLLDFLHIVCRFRELFRTLWRTCLPLSYVPVRTKQDNAKTGYTSSITIRRSWTTTFRGLQHAITPPSWPVSSSTWWRWTTCSLPK